jgi:HSP20 family protein
MNTMARIPNGTFTGLQDEMERMFRQVFGDTPSTAGAWSPALDVEETEDGFTLHVELPGVDPEQVEVSLEENVLTVTGSREFYADREAEGFRRVERRFGRFHRAVRLPDRVDGDRVQARYAHGLLTISVPKAEEAKPRRIAITAE